MITNNSIDTPDEESMRWIARIISIPWAYWTLLWTLLITLAACPNNPSMWAILIPAMVIAFVMCLGAAIVASVWGKEKLGGRVLVADSVLIFALCLASKIVGGGLDDMIKAGSIGILVLLTIVVPPLVAGTLFLASHKRLDKTRCVE